MSQINDESHIDEKLCTWTIMPVRLGYYSLIVVLSRLFITRNIVILF